MTNEKCDHCGARWGMDDNQWISIEDALPQIGQAVLVYQTFPKDSRFLCVAGPLVRCNYKMAEYGYNGKFRSAWPDSNEIKHISDWMPLPKSPGE